MNAWKQLELDGFAVLRGVLSPSEAGGAIQALEAALGGTEDAALRSQEGTVYAARNVLTVWPEAAEIWKRPPLFELLEALLGCTFGLVRVLFFDKPPGQTWALPWHKDLTVAVIDNRLPSSRFTKPTCKASVPHAVAPEEILQRMLTVRLHLDAATVENGPLKVIPGSHRDGKRLVLGSVLPWTVLAEAGDVLVMRPLLAHCSGRSRDGTSQHRRILHLEFTADAELPDGYAWHTFLPREALMKWNLLFVALCFAVSLLTAAADPKPPAAVRLTRDGGFKQHLSWSPDGKKLLCTRIHEGKMGLWMMDAAGGDWKPLLPATTPMFDGHWSPDSKKIVFVWDTLQGTDGKLQINSVNADGSDNKVLVPHKAFEESPRWSPDGKSIAWVSTRQGNQEIYSVGIAGGEPKRLTSENAFDNNPSWSPDGKQIAFASSRVGNYEIHAMNADGSNVRRLTNNPSLDYWPVWSPDGKRIAFTSNRDGNYEVYSMNADGTGLRNLTSHSKQDNFSAWSPDGKRIAFISNRDGGHDVYVLEVK